MDVHLMSTNAYTDRLSGLDPLLSIDGTTATHIGAMVHPPTCAVWKTPALCESDQLDNPRAAQCRPFVRPADLQSV
jgi:hypothetical protein